MVFIETSVMRAGILIKNALFSQFNIKFLFEHKHQCKPEVLRQSGRILKGVDVKGNTCQRGKMVRKILQQPTTT